VALLEKRRYLNNRSGDFPQVILIVPSHVPNKYSGGKHTAEQYVKYVDYNLKSQVLLKFREIRQCGKYVMAIACSEAPKRFMG
jgi:hypothetical protein